MPLFGRAFAVPNKSTTILYRFRSLSTVLCPTEDRRIQGLFKELKRFPSTFQGIFNFQGLFNSSTFQACANPGWPRGYKTFSMLNSAEHEIYPAHKC